MASPTSAFTVTGTSNSPTGGAGTVTQVTGTLNQIAVANPTSQPVVSFDPAFVTEFTNLQAAVASNQGSGSSSSAVVKNALINGEGSIAQRGASGNASFNFPNSITAYADDMWQVQTNGTPISLYQVSGPSGLGPSAIQIQRTANATQTNPVQYGQTLIPTTTSLLWGKVATFSFQAYALANLSGTLSIQIVGGTTTGPVSYLGTGFTNAQVLATETVTLTTAWQTYTLTVPQAIANTFSQLYVGFTYTPSGTAGASDGFVVSRRQLNEGTTALTYQSKTQADYLFECLPFYQKSYDLSVAPGTNTTAGSVTLSSVGFGTSYYAVGWGNLPLVRSMYFTPSTALYDASGGASFLKLGSISTKMLTLSNVPPPQTSGGTTYYNGSTASSQFVLDASPV